jgi:hypothetical protein
VQRRSRRNAHRDQLEQGVAPGEPAGEAHDHRRQAGRRRGRAGDPALVGCGAVPGWLPPPPLEPDPDPELPPPVVGVWSNDPCALEARTTGVAADVLDAAPAAFRAVTTTTTSVDPTSAAPSV